MPRPKSPITIAVQGIAARTGLTAPYLRQLHKDGGMPLEIEAALAWLNSRPDQNESDDDDGSVSALRRERIRLVRLQSAKAQLELDVRSGELMSRAEVDDRDRQIAHSLQAMFRKMENEIPALTLGKGYGESKELVKKQIRACQQAYADGSKEFWARQPMADKSEK